MNATITADVIDIGSTVTYTDRVNGDSRTVQIVASRESDPPRGLLSERSPIGQALLGHRAGENIRFMIPRGARHLRIDCVL
jgi:transcription elongation factor GreA